MKKGPVMPGFFLFGRSQPKPLFIMEPEIHHRTGEAAREIEVKKGCDGRP